MIGRVLAHFRVISVLGEGGMGVVYRAEDERLRRQVALKVLPPHLVADEERRLRFLREARAAAAVTHPNIAAIYETGEADGIVFIAMELVEGRTLRALLLDRPLPTRDALRIAVEIAEGLAEAHKSKVIHRDLKPDNVSIRPDGHVKILDFGLAKLLEPQVDAAQSGLSRLQTISGDMTREGRVFGTVAYMSPEQARGLPTDPRSDQFSFGVTLYEMATGRLPFRGKTATDTLTAVIRDDPEPPSSLSADVPAELDRIIGKCLEKDPEERYQDTRDLVVDLKKLKRVTDSGVQTVRTPSAPVETVRGAEVSTKERWRPGRRALLLGAVAVAAAVVAVGATLFWVRGRTGTETGRLKARDKVIVADFENTTGRPEFDTALRDAVERLLAESTALDVPRGDRLRDLIGAGSGSEFTRLDAGRAEALCRAGACDGFLAGGIAPEGSGYRIDTTLHRVSGNAPAISRSVAATSEGEILAVVHNLVLGLRRTLGENPRAVAATHPPTTRSLAAFQLETLGVFTSDPLEGLPLLRRAIETDPGYVEAYWNLGLSHFLLGDDVGYRSATRMAVERSATQPEQVRLISEILALDATYDYEKELDLLRSYTRLYPYDHRRQNYLGWILGAVYLDPPASEPAFRAAYEILPHGNLTVLSYCLANQGKSREIERLAEEHRVRGGSAEEIGWALLNAAAAHESPAEGLKAIDRIEAEYQLSKRQVALVRLFVLLAAGKLAEAHEASAALWREAGKSTDLMYQYFAASDQAWLEARRTGKPPTLTRDLVALGGRSLQRLPDFALKSIDMGTAGPLEEALRAHETTLKGSTSRFVIEELEFARGCLALTRGDADAARSRFEPLARSTEFARRHTALARAYEALGMWREAVPEYEAALKNPYDKGVSGNAAMWTLQKFRLARVHERLGEGGKAQGWYASFLKDWQDADPDIPEIIEARQRLAALGGPPAGPAGTP